VAQLLPFKKEFEARNTGVTVISFGTSDLAQKWILETGSSFRFLIDREHKAYQAYGLESSLVRSWSPRVWFAYARLMLQGWKWRGIQGDSWQLGGDFIVDFSGVLRMAYRSHDPTDRPKPEQIIQILDEIQPQS
jgi:peroxiredoxin